MERNPDDESAFDMAAGTYTSRRGGTTSRRGGGGGGGGGGRAASPSESSPALQPMEVIEPKAAAAPSLASRAKGLFAGLFKGSSGRSAASNTTESRTLLRDGDGRLTSEDSDDLDDRLASLTLDTVDMISSRPTATARGRSYGQPRRDIFDDV